MTTPETVLATLTEMADRLLAIRMFAALATPGMGAQDRLRLAARVVALVTGARAAAKGEWQPSTAESELLAKLTDRVEA